MLVCRERRERERERERESVCVVWMIKSESTLLTRNYSIPDGGVVNQQRRGEQRLAAAPASERGDGVGASPANFDGRRCCDAGACSYAD